MRSDDLSYAPGSRAEGMEEWPVPEEGWSYEQLSGLYWELVQSEMERNKLDSNMINPLGCTRNRERLNDMKCGDS